MNPSKLGSMCLYTAGIGTGGALATIRVNISDEAEFQSQVRPQLEEASLVHGICGVHLGAARPETTRIETKETELRADTGEDVFDAVVMIEGIGRREVEDAVKDIAVRIANLTTVTSTETATYDLAYLLTCEELNS